MTARRPALDQTLDRILHLADQLDTITSGQAEPLSKIRHTATELAHWLPRAQALTNRGDGLRSPALEPHRSSGGHSDPVGKLAVADWGDTGTTRRGPAGRLDQAADHIRTAALSLAHALREARTGQEAPEPIEGQRRDVAGQSVDLHIGDAATSLATALSLIQATLPKPYDPKTLHLQPTRDPGCLAHRTAGQPFEPSGPVKGACQWHYDFTRRYHRTCPPELTRHHDAGYHLTDKIVARAFAKKPLVAAAKAKPPRTPSRRERMLARIANLTSKTAGR